jgi:hypothetical protein
MLALILPQIGVTHDSLSQRTEAYTAVLEHVRTHHSGSAKLPIVLDAGVSKSQCLVDGRDCSSGDKHSPQLLARLQARRLVQQICTSPDSPECATLRSGHVSVSIGPLLPLPDSARVKQVPETRPVGVTLDEALRAIPDSAAVPASVAVDVVIRTPCTATSDAERCRVPDIVSYRYFLRELPDGSYCVVTRWKSGAV